MNHEKKDETLPAGLNDNASNGLEKDKKIKQKSTVMQATFRKIGFAFLFLLIGALIVSIALYLPARSSLLSAQSELDRLIPIEEEYLVLKEEFTAISSKASVYKILSNVNLLQKALNENEMNRISQYVRYVEEDLKDLDLPGYPDLTDSLVGQFKKTSAKVSNDQVSALDDLQDFSNDLLLLIDNLE